MGLSIGDRVKDKTDPFGDAAIVTDVTDTMARDCPVPKKGKTVAELNPDYEETDSVIRVVFEPILTSVIPNWPFMDTETLSRSVNEHNLTQYGYPRERLEQIGSGLLDEGVTLRAAGVADPITHDAGSYAFIVETEEAGELTRETAKITTDLDYIGKRIAGYIGIKEGLEWIQENKSDAGVIIENDDENLMNQLTEEYDPRGEEQEQYFNLVSDLRGSLSYTAIKPVPRQSHQDVLEIAIDTFHSEDIPTVEEDTDEPDDGGVQRSVEIVQVVGSQYLVDDQFAVDVERETCTCPESQSGTSCEHIDLVKDQS